MKNLAGDYNCNGTIVDELTLAEIPIRTAIVVIYPRHRTTTQKNGKTVPVMTFQQFPPLSYEVPSNYYGKIGKWTFKRAWYYWVVSGGKMPLDRAWEIYNDPVGNRDVRAFGHAGRVEPTWGNGDHVDLYHVDSQEGLNLLSRVIRYLSQFRENKIIEEN